MTKQLTTGADFHIHSGGPRSDLNEGRLINNTTCKQRDWIFYLKSR